MDEIINDQACDQHEQQNSAADVVDSTSKCSKAENENEGGGEGEGEDEEEEDEEEEEDVDFNPFLKGTPSPEASSSLSSDVEVLDGSPSKMSGEVVQKYNLGDSEHGEEVVMQNSVLLQSEKVEEPDHRKSKKRKNGRECDVGDDAICNSVLNSDEDDAICKRTRARYSLASFTLDELETFLQETDDEGDLQHADDEEEYRKFLAAVLQGGDGDGESAQENEMADDDEDNDADFEIELEELLDSDVDNSVKDKDRKGEYQRAGRRPETRQNRRQKASAVYKKKLLEQSKRPLRPIVPIFNNGTVASFPTISGRALTSPIAPSYLPSCVDEGVINGFTLQQIGQLHCLIHEHVQLLIQVYSLCILDPARQHIASQTKDMILEMLKKRDEAVASRRIQHPDICFRPPFVCPSVVDDFYGFHPAECSVGSSMVDTSTSNGRDMHASTEQMSSSQTVGSFWVPLIHSPVMSILNVAPLDLARTYIDDIYDAIQEHRRRHIGSDHDTIYEKEQLFHLPRIPPSSRSNGESARQNTSPCSSSPLSSPPQQPLKKTLAASIVESVKKQSVALVPKDISRLAQRFFSLFNPALYPHKPPPPSVANRVLFTDSEDELLALGILEYNTDWKAIQQRFLPCKSTHQIFVRQKNRCSSKAPENPIKAVRRMKNSPLSAQEIECIQEGLRVFKLDWISVWRFVVPHRDPSLLPRQWRIAIGTQRSYKIDAATKEKRRLYEAKRRKAKAAHNWQVVSEIEENQAEFTGGENISGDDYLDNNANESYVHQAFLADWRPGPSNLIPPETQFSDLGGKDLPSGQPYGYVTGATHMQRIPYIYNSQHRPGASHSTTLRSCWPPRTRGANLVKLAPDLPPVNLPPSVRVISRSSFKSNQPAVSTKMSTTRAGNGGKGVVAPQLPHVEHSSPTSSAKSKTSGRNQVAEATAGEDSIIAQETTIGEERGSDSDLQLHPLLFQAPEDGRLPYYPLQCSAGNSSSFSFFSGNQPQLNLSLFHNLHQSHHLSETNELSKDSATSCGIDFHPLLQRSDEENTEGNASLGGKSSQFGNPPIVSQNRQLGLSGQLAASKRGIIQEKSNKLLDLEIHLSSRSSKEKTRARRDMDANIQWSAANSKNTGNMKDVHTTDNSFHLHNKKCPEHQSTAVSDIDVSAFPSNDVSIMDVRGDRSHHDIVMEQEELSDSDEDEENVEFECEEMTDSEGEDGSGSETIPDAQEQEFPSSSRNGYVDHGDPQCEWQSPDHPQGNNSVPRIGTPTSLKLGLTHLDKDASNNSWLSLDSCAPVDSPQDKDKHQEGILDEAHTANKLDSGRPNRTCKKAARSMKGLAAQSDVTGMAPQLSLGPLASSTLKRPRKRGPQINSSIGTMAENSKIDQA